MEKLVLQKIGFGSYLKIFALNGLGFGVVTGVLMLIIALFGGDVTAYIGEREWYGITAGLIGLVMAPPLAAVISFFFGILMYLPFRLVLKVWKGITIKATIE